MLLLAAIAALLLGPLLLQFGHLGQGLRAALDGFTFISIAGLLVFAILPETLAAGGTPALGFVAAGLAFPWLLERRFERSLPQAHLAVLWLGIGGLGVHAMIDGVALAFGHEHSPLAGHADPGESLGAAVVLHRLPVGLAVWHLVAPQFGARIAIAALLLMCGATVLGFVAGPSWAGALDGPGLAWFQAFVAGSILHVIVYDPAHDKSAGLPAGRWPDRLGLLAGLALLYVYL